MTTIKNVSEGEKKIKSLIGFLSANKIDKYNGGGKEEKERKKNLQNKLKNKKNKCFS